MDNSTATKPYSRLKGDPYRAYEGLPVEVRRALQEALVDWCPLRAREWHLRLLREKRLRPAQATSALIQVIRSQDHAEVAAFARTWPKGAKAYPHLAAGATLQRYVGPEGIPAPEPVIIAPAAKRSRTLSGTSSNTPSKRASRTPSGKPSRTPPKRKPGRRTRR